MRLLHSCLRNLNARSSFVIKSIIGSHFPIWNFSPKREMNEIRSSNMTTSNNFGSNASVSETKSTILVYCGEGSSEDSRKLFYDALVEVVDPKYHTIEYITPEEIKKGTWTRTCQVIGFGGGYDLGFIRALGGKGTKIVRDFVQQGGSYLGFCAGAYWACNYIEFDKDGPLQVVGERFLKFFQGNCIGPAFPGFQYNTKKGVHAVPVTYNGLTLRSYLHGGGFFTLPPTALEQPISTLDSDQNGSADLKQYVSAGQTMDLTRSSSKDPQLLVSSVISESDDVNLEREFTSNTSLILSSIIPLQYSHHNRFSPTRGNQQMKQNRDYGHRSYQILGEFTSLGEHPGAFVKCSVGLGKAVLSGVHIEFPVALLDQDHPQLKPVLPALRESEAARNFVFKDILRQVDVKLKPPKSLL